MLSLLMASAGAGLSSGLGIGSSIGWLGGHLASNFVRKNKPIEVQSRRLTDLTVQTSTYGHPIPILFGQMVLGGNIIWSSGIREVATQEKIKIPSGQKIVQTQYDYFVDLAIALCEGPIDQVLRIWAEDVLVLDNTSQNSGPITSYSTPIRFYHGTETQIPDTLIQSKEGVHNVPAFKGLAYLVLENFPLRDFNHKIPHFRVEITAKAKETLKVIDIPTISDDLDNIVLSAKDQFLYLRDGNILQKINKITEEVELKYDLSEYLPRSDLFPTHLFGKMTLDPEAGVLYAFAQHHLSSFILVISAEDFSILRHNFEDRIIADEYIGFIDKDLFYSADFLKGSIRVYDKKHLTRLDYLLHGNLESGLHQRPSNFTKDDQDFLYMASYHSVEQKEIYLTKFQYGKDAELFTIKEHGYTDSIAFDQKTQSIIMNSSTGILKIDPATGGVLGKLSKCNSISNSVSGFLNQPVLNGFFWSFFDRKAYLINTESLEVEREINFYQLGLKPFGVCFDPETRSLWSKGRGLHKLLVDRFEGQPYELDLLVSDILQKGGCTSFLNLLHNEFVFGYTISEPQSLKDALLPLSLGYLFQWRDHEGKVEIFHRGEGGQKEILLADLGAHEYECASQTFSSLQIVKEGGVLPTKHICHYLSLERLYAPSCQEVDCGGSNTLSLSTQLPLVLKDVDALKIAETLLEQFWLGTHQCVLSLPPHYLGLEVGDSILCGPYHLLIEEMDIGANFRIELKTVYHKSDI